MVWEWRQEWRQAFGRTGLALGHVALMPFKRDKDLSRLLLFWNTRSALKSLSTAALNPNAAAAFPSLLRHADAQLL